MLTIAALMEVVLGFQRRLANAQASCTFVMEPAKELEEICGRAKQAESVVEFAMATSHEIAHGARQLVNILELDQLSQLWPLVRRIDVEAVGERQGWCDCSDPNAGS